MQACPCTASAILAVFRMYICPQVCHQGCKPSCNLFNSTLLVDKLSRQMAYSYQMRTGAVNCLQTILSGAIANNPWSAGFSLAIGACLLDLHNQAKPEAKGRLHQLSFKTTYLGLQDYIRQISVCLLDLHDHTKSKGKGLLQ